MIFLIIFLIIFIYLFLIGARRGKIKREGLTNYYYAHRGLHNKPEVPENSLKAFKLAAECGYGAELDVHLLSDGSLAVIHDSTLSRTTGADGVVEDLTSDSLKNFYLEGTDEKIPTLREVLDIFENRTPLVIELKAYKGNHKKLTETVCKELDSFKGKYCIESFDPRCLMWLKRNRPDIIRGQLSQNFMLTPSGQGRILDFILTNLFLNVVTRPDFIAYRFEDRKNLSNILATKLFGAAPFTWTVTDDLVMEKVKLEKLTPIFEKIKPNK
jgi:glycerophosphoryl diester phosphodiesterase